MAAEQSKAGLIDLRRWLTATGALTSAVNSGRDLGEVLTLVADTARSLLAVDFCGVLVPDASRSTLVITGWSGLTADYVSRVNSVLPILIDTDPTKEAPSSRAFRSGRPVAIADISRESGFTWGGFAREQGYQSMLSMPLAAGADVVGTLNIYHRIPHEFTDFEVERLRLLADHAALALTSAKILSDLRSQHDLITRSEWIHDRLIGLALREGGVEGITRAVAELLSADVLLEAAHGEVLAVAGRRGNAATPDLRAEFVRGVDDPTNVVHSHEGHSVVNVVLGNAVTARLWVAREVAGLGALDRRALEHATVVLSLEFLRQRTAAEVEQRLRGEILANILEGADVRAESLLTRAHLLGHDLTRPHMAVVGKARQANGTDISDTASQRLAEKVSRLAEGYTPRPLVAMHRDLLVVLWPTSAVPANPETSAPLSGARAVGEAIRQVMKAVPGVGSVTAAVSLPVHGSLLGTHRTAVGALTISTSNSAIDRTVTLADLGVMGILLQIEDASQLFAFADRTLGVIRRHDEQRGTALIHTMRTFLDAGLDRSATAEQLVLHPNTVSQRLRRIEGLSGLNLADSSTVVDVRAALMVMDVAVGLASAGPPVEVPTEHR